MGRKKTHQYIPSHHLTLTHSLSQCYSTTPPHGKKLLWNKKKSFEGKTTNLHTRAHSHTQTAARKKENFQTFLFYWKFFSGYKSFHRTLPHPPCSPTIKNDNPENKKVHLGQRNASSFALLAVAVEMRRTIFFRVLWLINKREQLNLDTDLW